MKKITILSAFAVLAMLVTSCQPDESSDSIDSSLTTSEQTSTNTTSKPSTNTSTGPSISVDERDNYDQWLDTWSQPNHMYIHYQRNNVSSYEDYKDYGLWLWGAENSGALFAGEGASSMFHKNTTKWVQDIGGSGDSVDQAGVVCDIDLGSTTYKQSMTGKPISFDGIDKLGYLVVKTSTMSTGSLWTKDGADNYITDIQTNFRSNGSIHVFLKQGQTEYYRHFYNEQAYENPINTDTTGNYRSQTNLNSSTPYNKDVPTSEEFYKNGGVGYEVFVPSFRDSNNDGMGDIRGVIDSLDYLKSLSIKVLWLSPIFECNTYHGYDTVDYYNVDPRFGTNGDLDELIFQAHQKDMYVILDLVVNHASNQSIWFKKARRGEVGVDSKGNEIKYRDLFHFKYLGDTTTGTTKVEDDPDWFQDGSSNYYYYAKFADSMPEFNYDYQGTRDMVLDMASYWLGKGIDGYRLDAIKHIYMTDESTNASTDKIHEDKGIRTFFNEESQVMDSVEYDYSTNETKNLSFWKEFSHKLKRLYPSTYLVGENFDGWDQRIAPMYESMDSQFDFNTYYHNLEYLYSGMDSSVFNVNKHIQETNLKWDYFKEYRQDFINASFTSNHDVSRAMNHINSIKNSQAESEQDIKITGTATQIGKAKVHAAITMLQPGISFIYSGDELGMSSNTTENEFSHDNNLDRYYRQSFKWADESLRPSLEFGSGYTNAYDEYNEYTLKNELQQDSDSQSMLNFYRGINAVKQSEDYPKNGDFVGYPYGDNPDVFYFVISPNAKSGGRTHRVWIHTGGRSGTSSPITPYIDGSTVVYSSNYTSGSLSSYGVVIACEN